MLKYPELIVWYLQCFIITA